eukprot:TRINITY_DN1652_c0_g1_i2.p1 TRINITY_DN1652_c0_g1~~TRINITY_DN1652_c0_g1_i2.p1  ORF type:complete len:176 (+),score=3.58 TRINITY_DN1652_c0_g1_i2:535-1062(+)
MLGDLHSRQPKTIEEIEDYAENTSAALYYLTLEVLNIRNQEADHCASHLGKGMGLVTLLRGIPHQWPRGEIYLPQELTLKLGVTQEQLRRSEFDPQVGDVIYEVANIAKSHIQHARNIKSNLPRGTHVAFLPAAFGDHYLNALQKHNFNPLEPNLQQYGFGPRFKTALNYYTKSY